MLNDGTGRQACRQREYFSRHRKDGSSRRSMAIGLISPINRSACVLGYARTGRDAPIVFVRGLVATRGRPGKAANECSSSSAALRVMTCDLQNRARRASGCVRTMPCSLARPNRVEEQREKGKVRRASPIRISYVFF
jgi:hypothetical protein